MSVQVCERVRSSAGTELRVEACDSLEAFLRLGAAWNRLLDLQPDGTVFQSFEWNEAWWRAFGAGKQLYVLVVYDRDRLIGIAPFFRHVRRIGFVRYRELAFLGDVVSDYCRFVVADGREEEVMRAIVKHLLERRRDWEVVRLTEMPQAAHIRWQAATGSVRSACRHRHTVKTFTLDTRQDWDTYWKALSGRYRTKFRRQQRVLERCRIKLYSGEEITPEVLENVAEINRGGPEKKRAGSPFLSEPLRRFHWQFLFESSLKNCFQIMMLYIGRKAAAYNYSFKFRNALVEYNSNYHQSFAAVSAGQYLHVLQIQYAFAAGFRAVDLMRGEYDYKRSLRCESGQNYESLLFQGRAVRNAYLSVEAVAALVRRGYVAWLLPVKRAVLPAGTWARRSWISARALGWRRLCEQGWSMIRSRIWLNREMLLLQAVSQKAAAAARTRPPDPECRIRELKLRDHELLESGYGFERMHGWIKRWWEGDRCWGAICGNRLVGYGWVAKIDRMDPQAGMMIRSGKDRSHIYELSVDPAFQERGLMEGLVSCMVQDAEVLKSRHCTMLVRPDDEKQVQAWRQLGFLPAERIRRVKIGGFFKRQIHVPARLQ